MKSSSSAKIAVLGASSSLGREILQILAEREFALSQVFALDWGHLVGSTAAYGDDDDLDVLAAKDFDFTNVDIVISTLKDEEALARITKIADDGTLVIDATGAFLTDTDVPLAVPEVNADVIARPAKNIISCPSSPSILLATALVALHKVAPLKRVVAATYQSVSSEGRAAMDELFSQTRAIYVNDPISKEHFAKQIAFNVIPQTAALREDGTTEDEFRMAVELKRLLGAKVKIAASCAFVAAFLGQGIAVTAEFDGEMDSDIARKALRGATGVTLIDLKADEGMVSLVEVVGEDDVFVSRLRDDVTVDNGVIFWIAGDNMRKGSALNAVQIAEEWAKTNG